MLANKRNGQVLIELIIALAIASTMIIAASEFVAGTLIAQLQSKERLEANGLAQEYLEAMRSVREGSWANLVNGTYKITVSNGGSWQLESAPGGEDVGIFNRKVELADLCRDTNEQIVTCGTADPASKKATIAVSWTVRGVAQNISGTFYLTRHLNDNAYLQSDWLGGSGFASDATTTDWTKYDTSSNIDQASTPGSIKLTFASGSFQSPGELVSTSLDIGGLAAFNTIAWTPVAQPTNTSVKAQIATNNDNATWNFKGPDCTATTYYTITTSDPEARVNRSCNNDQRYLKYKLILETTDASNTPTVEEMIINFSQ